ncbi:toll/interleukin-1 receptor domain-containing protein [Novosphingobium sp. KA1]|uniref:toll/interleukin-1 receptor domain-containing protein n=1 Tax=Novosphingobium sp. (strain KA1) TaxID=164608 RepID=UPI001A8C8D76|nr:toll/interleukin-1 receptor domain-containing protein [Novosphingobium sp. KA1]QSR17474.1 hypothetical protein CA833_09810 [Novosphingobium sp. KA1]
MEKKTIFLSHISEEGELGTIFKNRLEKDFLSLIDVFVSSDARSIPPGDAWLKAVDDNLDRATALIVLASPTSVARPWITFEAGAGWAKRVPTMILCHSGMAPGGLPLPLGQLQAFLATDLSRLGSMYEVIAKVLGSATPEPDLTNFRAEIQNFERSYTEERDILSALRQIHSADREIIPKMRGLSVGSPVQLRDIRESTIRRIEPALNQLRDRGVLQWNYNITALHLGGSGGGGHFGNFLLTLSPALVPLLQSSEFN